MGFKETLELLVTANVQGAVSGMDKVGSAADKNLGKTQTHLDAVGGKMQTVGAGMVGMASIALVGLGKLAGAADAAQQVTNKLNNAVQNAPQITDKSTTAYEHLAEKLAKVTVFDDDATKSMMANMAATGATTDQILNLTPAVQDLAVKTGDLSSAGDLVTAALNGKKKGLEKLIGPLDAALYATDRYAAVTQGLARVQGLATEQGQTFSGQLQIMQNRMGELAEGVGVGAVNAFSNLFGAFSFVLDKLESLAPGTQSAAGEMATYASIAGGTAGALTFVAGSAIKAAYSFGVLAKAEDGASHITKGGQYGIIAGSVLALAAAYKVGSDNAETFAYSAGQINKATPQQMQDFVGLTEKAAKLGISYREMGDAIASKSVPEALKFADALDAQGKSSVEVRAAVEAHNEALRMSAEAAKADAAALQGVTVEEYDFEQSVKDGKKAIEEYDTAVKNLNDTFKSMVDGTLSTFEAQIQLNEAQVQARSSLAELDKVTKDAKHTEDEYISSRDKALSAIIDEAKANEGLYEAQVKASGGTVDATTANTKLIEELYKVAGTLDPKSPLRAQLTDYITQLQGVPGQVTTVANLDSSAAVQAVIDFQRMLAGIPANVDTSYTWRSSPGRNAGGTNNWRGGPTWVGEQGPEIVNLPRGSQVIPNGRSMAMAGSPNSAMGGNSPTYVINVSTMDARGVEEKVIDALTSIERRDGRLPLRSVR